MASARLALVLGLILPAAALAASGPVWAGDSYVVGVENIAYLPAYDGSTANYGGFARQILDAFAKDSDLTFSYRPLPVARLMASLNAGAVDFKFPDNVNWDQTEKQGMVIRYSDPVCRYVDGTVVPLAKKGQDIEKVRTIGTVTGFTAWSWMPQITAARVTVKENASFEALLRQAVAGRVDGVYASIANVTYAQDHGVVAPGSLVFDPALPHDDNFYFLSTIRHGAVIERFNQWMATHAELVATLKTDSGVEKGLP